jgi:predicted AAA+ superfamily ATPase
MKLYFLDVGLLNAAMNLDAKNLFKFNGADLMSKGTMVEQFVAQHLYNHNFYNSDTQLYYWLNDKKGANAEVDFVLEFDGMITPLEVKSGSMGKMKSLFQFIGRKHCSTGVKLDLTHRDEWISDVNTKIRIGMENAPINFQLITLPVFFVTRLFQLLPKES